VPWTWIMFAPDQRKMDFFNTHRWDEKVGPRSRMALS
jgi:hypothetical protein